MVSLQELPEELLVLVLSFCPDLVSKGVIQQLNKWFRNFVHRWARPISVLRRELLEKNVVFKIGPLDWRGSRVCQRTRVVSRMRPLVPARPHGDCRHLNRPMGDIPLSLNDFGVESTLVWDAIPEAIRGHLALTRMTVQLREVWTASGYARVHQWLDCLRQEAEPLGASVAAAYERISHVLRSSSDRFLVVNFPLLGRRSARIGTRSRANVLHVIVPVGDFGVLPEGRVGGAPTELLVSSSRGAVEQVLAKTKFSLSYADMRDRIRRSLAAQPRQVDSPVRRQHMKVTTLELFSAGEQFRQTCAVAVERQRNLERIGIASRKRAHQMAQQMRLSPTAQKQRRFAARFFPFGRIERMCASVYSDAVSTGRHPPEVINLALHHIVVLGVVALIPLHRTIWRLYHSGDNQTGHFEMLIWLLERFPTMEHILEEVMAVQSLMVMSNGIEAYPANLGMAEAPRFLLVDVPDAPDSEQRAASNDMDEFVPKLLGRVGSVVDHVESGSIIQNVEYYAVFVSNILTCRIMNAFETRHWVSVFSQHAEASRSGWQTVDDAWTYSWRPNLGITEFLMQLAEYAFGQATNFPMCLEYVTDHHRFMQAEVRPEVSAYYDQLVSSGFPQECLRAVVNATETGILLGLGGIRMRPCRTTVSAGDHLQVLPGRVYHEGRVMIPVRTSHGVFMLLAESAVLMSGPRWSGPGRLWEPRALSLHEAGTASIELLKTCMFSAPWANRYGGENGAYAKVVWSDVVADEDPCVGVDRAEMLFNSAFEETVLEHWYPATRSGSRQHAMDHPNRADSLARLSVLYHYLASRFQIAEELKRTS